MNDKLHDFFDACPNFAEISFVRGEKSKYGPCVCIKWSQKGRGFGEYTFFKKDGKWKIDNEGDGPEAILSVLVLLLKDVEFVDRRYGIKGPDHET